MPFIDQDLPYSVNHLAPVISENTVNFHYGKHQIGYAQKLESLTNSTPYENMDLVFVIKETAFDNANVAIYNNAAQLWNHIFYWDGLKAPDDKNVIPDGSFADLVKVTFGSFENLKLKLIDAATNLFGSGWAWLVFNPKTKEISVIRTQNAANPLTLDLIPLLTIDVWEHAYYLDYQNRRAEYVTNLVEKLLDWNTVQERYMVALGQ